MAGSSIGSLLKKDKNLSKTIKNMTDVRSQKEEFISTNVMTLNILCSGRVDGGIPVGKVSGISAQSMTGKSFLGYGLARNGRRLGKTVVVIDTEYAFDIGLAEKLGIDVDADEFILIQTCAIEKVKQRVLEIDELVPDDRKREVLYILDSFGPLVSSKSVADGLAGKDVKDMTLTQKKNELMNLFLMTESTVFVVNHVITNIGGMGDPLAIPGGNKIIFNSSVLILGRSKAKQTDSEKEITGYIVSAVNHKSRGCRENSHLKYRIKVDGGMDIFYGLLPDALEGGYVESPSLGWYSRPVVEDDKKWREVQIYCAEFWAEIFKNTDFADYLNRKYTHSGGLDMNIDYEPMMIEQKPEAPVKATRSRKAAAAAIATPENVIEVEIQEVVE